jgi:hypothetical protein
VYFGALARKELGQKADANADLKRLLDSANAALAKEPSAESGRTRRHRTPEVALAHYLAGLSYLGLGESEEGKAELRLALQAAPDLLGAKCALTALP